MKSLTLIPAYGRDYSSKKSLLKDFNDNKDFMANDLYNSGYVNKSELSGEYMITFRYGKLRKVFVHYL